MYSLCFNACRKSFLRASELEDATARVRANGPSRIPRAWFRRWVGISGNFGAEEADSLIRVPFGLFIRQGRGRRFPGFDHATAQRNDEMRPA